MEANGPTSTIEPEVIAAAPRTPLDGGDGVAAAPASESPPAAAARQAPRVRRTGIVLKPNNSRVVIRPFEPTSESRIERIIARVMSLTEAEVEAMIGDVMREFYNRHQKTRHFFLNRFEQVRRHLLTDRDLAED